MLNTRKRVRDFLVYADRPTFLETVYRAKVSPRQRDILYRKFLDGHSNTKIAMELFVSIETVRDDLALAYDMLFRYLFTA